MLADGTQHPAGIADCYNIGGNIFCRNASCADHSVVPDGNSPAPSQQLRPIWMGKLY